MTTVPRFAVGELHRITFTADGRSYEFDGRVLAVASSQKIGHNARPHDADGVVPRGTTCSACRWIELAIYRRHHVEPSRDDYVVVRVGRSRAPGEVTLEKVLETQSAYEVVEFLTVRRPPGGDRPGETFMPPQHARALAVASQFDADIRDAYVNRAVV